MFITTNFTEMFIPAFPSIYHTMVVLAERQGGLGQAGHQLPVVLNQLDQGLSLLLILHHVDESGDQPHALKM
jgi:hypothetical protein